MVAEREAWEAKVEELDANLKAPRQIVDNYNKKEV